MRKSALYDHTLRHKEPRAAATTVTTSTSGLAQPFLTGSRYYPETFTSQSSGTSLETIVTAGAGSYTCIGPMFTGGARSWDRIGIFIRHASAPGTSPDYYFVVYALDNTTLLPTSLLYQSAVARQPGAAVLTFEEDTITLSTTVSWLGIGWHWPGDSETIGFRCPGVATAAVAADVYHGYVPYGMARTGDVLSPGISLWATQAAGTATAAPTSAFGFPAPTGAVPFRGSGVFLRQV